MAIMISIQPQHCENILNLIKTLEIRKSCPKEWKDYLSGKTKVKPKAEKVYIYCTKQGRPLVYGDVQCASGYTERYTQTYNWSKKDADRIWGNLQGKVVACFTLNEVEQYGFMYSPLMFINSYFKVQNDKLTGEELDYGKCCISKKELMEYANDGKLIPKPLYAWHIDDLKIYDTPKAIEEFGINRVPQSWCYCKELEEEDENN